MKHSVIATLAMLVSAVCALDVTFYEGTADDDCAGTTTTVDSATPNGCIYDSGQTFSCILVSYEGANVATSVVYSKQSNNYCAVPLVKMLEDGEYYENTGAITGYNYTTSSTKTSAPTKPSGVQEAAKTKRGEEGAFKYVGYTVKGRTYDVPEDVARVVKLKRGADTQEEWLKRRRYTVIHQRAK